MIRAIVDNPHACYPKFPRVIEAETEERLDQQIMRCVRGVKGQYTAEQYARTTVTRVTGTLDQTARYVKAAGE
ncbi:hypothetical protein [Streptomyces virginiae]|uniref:hypothetical protein n=1 Tax=Streptomyces virginiae TaxID=1961 RepID=UPI0036E60C0F